VFWDLLVRLHFVQGNLIYTQLMLIAKSVCSFVITLVNITLASHGSYCATLCSFLLHLLLGMYLEISHSATKLCCWLASWLMSVNTVSACHSCANTLCCSYSTYFIFLIVCNVLWCRPTQNSPSIKFKKRSLWHKKPAVCLQIFLKWVILN